MTPSRKAIGAACRDVGFFYVVNHGVDAELLAEAFTQSKRFFARPLTAKQELAIEKIGGNRGYIGFLHEALDPAQGADMKESFNIGLELAPDDPEILAASAVPLRSTRGPMSTDFARLCSPTTKLVQPWAQNFTAPSPAISASISISSPTNSGGRWRRCACSTIPRPLRSAKPSRAGAHTDYGNLTLLATDDVGGLEVRAALGRLD